MCLIHADHTSFHCVMDICCHILHTETFFDTLISVIMHKSWPQYDIEVGIYFALNFCLSLISRLHKKKRMLQDSTYWTWICSYILNFSTSNVIYYYRYGVLQTANLRLITLAILPIWILWQCHLMVPFVLLEERYDIGCSIKPAIE
jgi:hypothetical protein